MLLQNDGAVAKAYQAHGTPTAYFMSAHGKVASELAIGAEALLKLVSQPAQELPLIRTRERPPAPVAQALWQIPNTQTSNRACQVGRCGIEPEEFNDAASMGFGRAVQAFLPFLYGRVGDSNAQYFGQFAL